ncbi:MAG: hypothetical protein NTX25_12315, partial [Proteobacteria bacterium]|nr:hypothetical protein [Pseudomonadota bacterium]
MLRRHILRLSIACGLACWLIASCKPKEENSEVKGFVTCTAVDALGAFIDSIPVPGMSLLSKIPAMAASAVAGKLKSMGKGKLGAVSGCAGGASLTEVSDNSLGQIKEIVRDAYAEQNHLDAKASLVSLQTAWDRFVPDTETAHDYTMNNLNDMAKIADDWWARYDRSGQRIYNVNDFILVTGVQLKVLQEQVHTVALGAAKTGGQDEIGRVRSYAENLARTADHVRKELFEIAEKDIYGMARAMYSLNQVQDGPLVYDGAAFYPHQNICYFSKNRQSIDLSKPKAAHETHSINELSAWLGMYGAICCSFGRDGTCKN